MFDCASLADDVLATLGQIFRIISVRRWQAQAPPRLHRITPAHPAHPASPQNPEPVTRGYSAPALPPNHPTMKEEDQHLKGIAALQAAPKVEPAGEVFPRLVLVVSFSSSVFLPCSCLYALCVLTACPVPCLARRTL